MSRTTFQAYLSIQLPCIIKTPAEDVGLFANFFFFSISYRKKKNNFKSNALVKKQSIEFYCCKKMFEGQWVFQKLIKRRHLSDNKLVVPKISKIHKRKISFNFFFF